MKILPSSLLFLCLPLPTVPAIAQPPTANLSLPARAAEPELSYETFDYYDFSAMNRSPAGRALRERIFGELKNAPDTATLLKNLNAKYALSVPESVRRAILAKFSFHGDESFNTAEFEFSEKNIANAFFDLLRERTFPWENHPENIEPDESPTLQEPRISNVGNIPPNVPRPDSAAPELRVPTPPAETLRTEERLPVPGVVLPQQLQRNLPPAFLENATQVVVTHPAPTRISVLASSRPLSEIPDFPHLKGYAESLGEASLPGVLIYRKFARRAAEISGFTLSFPPGEFIVSEEADRVKISVDFHCKDISEAAFMEHFFLRFKLSLIDSAKRQPAPARVQLLAVGKALKLTRTGTSLKLDIDCAAEDFPAFLQWRSVWFPKR
ncbi:MAG: hypothetical protein J6L64_02970 [Opitutales bacterium]|nr:hypothetical protein [Opitutales bacterium]